MHQNEKIIVGSLNNYIKNKKNINNIIEMILLLNLKILPDSPAQKKLNNYLYKI